MRRWLGFQDMTTLAVLATVLVCFVSPIVHWLTMGPAAPQVTYVQVSLLPAIGDLTDPFDILYSFVRPPIYELLDWAFTIPAAFVLVGLACHGMFNFLIFTLAYRGVMRTDSSPAPFTPWLTALLVMVTVYPLGLVLGITGHGTTLLPHDTYYTFSVRTFFWILCVLSFILALERRWGAAFLVMALSCYPHPSAGVTGFGLLTLLAAPHLWRHRSRRLMLTWGAAALLGALPNLTKYLLVDLPPELTGTMDYGAWYSQNIKDEADDFSILFQLVRRGPTVAVIVAALGATLGAYASLVPGFRRHIAFWCTASIPVLFLGGALVEYAFAVVLPTFLVHPIAAMTLGYRLLSYAFPPFIVVFACVLSSVLNRGCAWVSRSRPGLTGGRFCAVVTSLTVIAVWSAFVVVGLYRGLAAPSLAYGRWALQAGPISGIDAYFVAARDSGVNVYSQPKLYLGAGNFKTYPGNRNIFSITREDRAQPERVEDRAHDESRSLDSFVEIITAVRERIPEREGLYVPIHLRHFRDALPKHPIFFQEHPDGNLMVVSPAAARLCLDRMRDLIGITYEDMPCKDTGLMYTMLRNGYLDIDTPKLQQLRQKYPDYRYFLTEKHHAAAFEPVIETNAFVVYDLSKPTESGDPDG